MLDEHRSDLIDFVLVVDEINRGNLAKIFGELYFLLEYRDEAIDLMYSSGDAERFTLPRTVVIIFRDRAPRIVRSLSWTPRCAAASDLFRCTGRRGPRNLLLRRWLTARRYPQRVADLHLACSAAIDDPDAPVRTLVFSCVRRSTVMGDWRRCCGSAIIPLLEELRFGDPAVDLEARYGLVALEKSLTTGLTRRLLSCRPEIPAPDLAPSCTFFENGVGDPTERVPGMPMAIPRAAMGTGSVPKRPARGV